ncbi:unnamed protein product [Gadus morhua 'NCC']
MREGRGVQDSQRASLLDELTDSSALSSMQADRRPASRRESEGLAGAAAAWRTLLQESALQLEPIITHRAAGSTEADDNILETVVVVGGPAAGDAFVMFCHYTPPHEPGPLPLPCPSFLRQSDLPPSPRPSLSPPGPPPGLTLVGPSRPQSLLPSPPWPQRGLV